MIQLGFGGGVLIWDVNWEFNETIEREERRGEEKRREEETVE